MRGEVAVVLALGLVVLLATALIAIIGMGLMVGAQLGVRP